MKLIKNHNIIPALFCILFAYNACAKVVEYIEDAYAKQAPKKIVAIVKKAALLMDFKGVYEVVVPKKAGIQVNPWNKFIAQGINTLTKNPFIIVNPQWFSSIPQNQQTFLLGRFFLIFKHGSTTLGMKIIPYLSDLFILFLAFLLTWGLGKTRLAHHKKWIRFIIAFSIMIACYITFLSNLETKLLQHFGSKYDIKINEMVVQKTLNKDSAIKALKFFDTSIKQELKNGETFWAPYESLFKKYADKL